MSVHALPDPLTVHMTAPATFNECRRIADRVKSGAPVFVDLRAADAGLVARLLDFATGLAAAVDGSVTRVSDNLVLVAPSQVAVSGEVPEATPAPDPAVMRPMRRLGLA